MINYLAGVTVVISGLTLVGLGVLALRGHQIGVARDDDLAAIRRDDELIEALRAGTPNWNLPTEPLLPLLVEWRDEVTS